MSHLWSRQVFQCPAFLPRVRRGRTCRLTLHPTGACLMARGSICQDDGCPAGKSMEQAAEVASTLHAAPAGGHTLGQFPRPVRVQSRMLFTESSVAEDVIGGAGTTREPSVPCGHPAAVAKHLCRHRPVHGSRSCIHRSGRSLMPLDLQCETSSPRVNCDSAPSMASCDRNDSIQACQYVYSRGANY